MTLAELNEICRKNNIKDDVRLFSDSGWECCETPMNGIWYSEIDNAIVFVQESEAEEYIVDGASWHDLSNNQKLKRLK